MDKKNKKDQATEDTTNKAETPKETKPKQAPADALSMTPDELGQTAPTADQTGENITKAASKKDTKRFGKLRRIFRRVNIYLMAFTILLVIAAAITVITWLYSQEQPPEAVIGTEQLSQEALQELASGDASVGNARQRLTIKGDTTIEGQTLLRSNLDVAGSIQSSERISAVDLIVSGTSNLSNTQIDQLQIAGNTNSQGDLTIGGGLSVAGATTLNGPTTASRITASELVLSGSGRLEVSNHVAFTGPTPRQNINYGVLGAGSSASLNGSDTSGTINFNTGTGTSSGCMTTVMFSNAFTTTPRVVVTPVNAAGGNLNFYVTRDTSSFSICTNNAPAVGSAFSFDYFVAG